MIRFVIIYLTIHFPPLNAWIRATNFPILLMIALYERELSEPLLYTLFIDRLSRPIQEDRFEWLL
jgi:hypothetical protein